ncbi:hypothetical protein LQ757_10155 [Agromyces sp. SYSU K20354]|uniref:hypothetical protein n=1 Tax=Agromyces cavernae TaxID=2898659 RepID=UPI001E58A41D|nr:hypothetical protein [Agromyces cavernae]MCD2442633.1 hypothetical protein [Agromyces cavernae]
MALPAFGLVLMATLSACAVGASTQGTDRTDAPDATVAPTEPEHIEFDPAAFDDSSAVIDNPWLVMLPGTQWIYDGFLETPEETLPHTIEFTVTDLTKEIQGVSTAVAFIVDVTDGEIVEKEIAFYAQNVDGDVWYFGEHPVEYDKSEVVAAPTWIAGYDGALPGVKMWADPKVGMPSYFQGYAESVDWTDYGTIDEMGVETCTDAECFEDTLVIAESSLGEEDIFQLKHYAEGIGEVSVGWRGEPEEKEGLQLESVTQLSPEALAAIRAEALALEAHAYEVSADVYGQTAPSS